MSWTDERIEVLRKLWAEGMSASQIASSLGGVTRNAVIGKIHRLGLSGRVKAPQTRATRARSAPIVAPKPAAAPRVMAAGAVAVKVVEEPEIEEIPQTAEIVPLTEGMTLMDLSASTCRWPVGDPSDPAFRFCGARTTQGDTYCRAHAEQAFPSRRSKSS
ncbi:GcrA family cell cycle regulator [Acuticoccus sp. I52.16.1]|uniref:GcrA family cell cycle regulator n=1 Tax=Acuticoccus sp. I52.16.1 TaxID=2928472 RepID=UPI001FCFF3C7|nr:GcrA family cell cycle regulator [Acuticoccus sp. I52.16.1]UOM32761.1 GcrA cell cycle regulator [Acuticoccus sp. I52.16.1]